jgi:hypothetical protein
VDGCAVHKYHLHVEVDYQAGIPIAPYTIGFHLKQFHQASPISCAVASTAVPLPF